MRKLVLLAGMLALVFLVVAPALSQTDSDSNPNDNGIIGDVLDLLGGSDEGNDGEGEAVNLDTDADADANADIGAGVGEDEEGDATDNDATDNDATDDGIDTPEGEDGNDEGEGDDGIVDNDDGNDDGGDATDDVIDTPEGEDGNDEGEDDEKNSITDDLLDWLDSHEGDEDSNDEGDEGDEKSGITDDLLDWLASREGDDDQNSADEDDVAAAGKAGAERKNDGRNDNDARDDVRDDVRDILSGEGSESISSFEQDTNSGDITQTFSVTGPGDNASQCLNISPVANSGNAQNQIGGQIGGGNVKFNDVNSTLDVSGGSTVTCDQPINQAATASGGYYSGY